MLFIYFLSYTKYQVSIQHNPLLICMCNLCVASLFFYLTFSSQYDFLDELL